jgi:hypothetical protein
MKSQAVPGPPLNHYSANWAQIGRYGRNHKGSQPGSKEEPSTAADDGSGTVLGGRIPLSALMGFPFPLGLRRRHRRPCCGADAGEQPLQGEPEQIVGNPGAVEEPLPD